MANIELKPDESVNVGDFFLDNKTKEVYIAAQISPQKYVLICLNDGERWTEGVENIEEVFGNSKNKLTKITRPFTVTP